jgi:hypothetical protein
MSIECGLLTNRTRFGDSVRTGRLMMCPLALPQILADVPQTEICGADRPQLQA